VWNSRLHGTPPINCGEFPVWCFVRGGTTFNLNWRGNHYNNITIVLLCWHQCHGLYTTEVFKEAPRKLFLIKNWIIANVCIMVNTPGISLFCRHESDSINYKCYMNRKTWVENIAFIQGKKITTNKCLRSSITIYNNLEC